MRRSVVVVGLAAILLVACSDGDDEPSAVSTSSVSTTSTTSGPATTTKAEGPRTAAYIKSVDVERGRLSYDEIQFLTGDAADDAYEKDNPGDSDGPPNDYYIVNDDPELRLGTISSDAEVTLNILAGKDPSPESRPGTLQELANAFVSDDQRSSFSATVPFWLYFEDDVIVKIEEQYVP